MIHDARRVACVKSVTLRSVETAHALHVQHQVVVVDVESPFAGASREYRTRTRRNHRVMPLLVPL